MKLLHAADLHVDSPLHGLARYEGAPEAEIRGATRKALVNLVNLALHEQVDAVVIAGDLYDGDWRDYRTGLFVVNELRRLSDAEIPCYIVAGNHDAASQITRYLTLPKGIHLFSAAHPETLIDENLGLAVHGRSYPKRDTTEDLAASYPPAAGGLFNVGLLHTALDGRLGHALYAPTTMDCLLASDYQYWALGHVHKRHVVYDQGPLVVFPGNTQGRHSRETGAKGVTIVTVEDLRIVEQRFVALDVVRWSAVEVDARECVDIQDVLAGMEDRFRFEVQAAQGRLCAVRVRVSGPTQAHHSLWKARDRFVAEVHSCGSAVEGIWVEKVELATDPVPSGSQQPEVDLSPALRALKSVAGSDEALRTLVTETDLYRFLPEIVKAHLGLDEPDALNALRKAAAGRLAAVLSAGEDV